MRVKSIMLFASALAVLLPAPAQAWWQQQKRWGLDYARWGMTEDQLLAASGGQVTRRPIRRRTPGEATERIVGQQIAGTATYAIPVPQAGISHYPVDVSFSFRAGGLSQVELRPPQGMTDCVRFGRDLRTSIAAFARAGHASLVEDAPSRLRWDDRRNGERMTFSLSGHSCSITIEPAPAA